MVYSRGLLSLASQEARGFESHLLRQGEVLERPNRSVLKTDVGIYPHRGFESHPHRLQKNNIKHGKSWRGNRANLKK